jgi:hypothetical protein
MGKLAFTAKRSRDVEVGRDELVAPLLAQQGKLVLQVCNTSYYEDPRLFNVTNAGAGCGGAKVNPICLDSFYTACLRTWYCPRYCTQDYHCVTAYNAAQGEGTLDQSTVTCRGANKGTHISRGVCAVKISMCTNVTITPDAASVKSISETCKPHANPQVCQKDRAVVKFDRWGSFWWAVPVQDGGATRETAFWAGRADEFTSSSDADVLDTTPADRTSDYLYGHDDNLVGV